jgi:hypothetical protein
LLKETCEQVLTLFRSIEPNTNQSQGDITQLKGLPAIILTGPRLNEVKNMRSQAKLVEIDKINMEYTKEKAPRWYDLVYDVLAATETFRELMDRLESLSRLAQSEPLLTVEQDATGRVRQYSWEWGTFPGNSGRPNTSGVYEAVGQLIVRDIEIYSGVTETGPLIRTIEIGIAPDSGDATGMPCPAGADEIKIIVTENGVSEEQE